MFTQLRQWWLARQAAQLRDRKVRIQTEIVSAWQRRFWWRFPPAEGWQPGFNCDFLPEEAQEHFRVNGSFIPPTYSEVFADCDLVGGTHQLRYCPADRHLYLSLPKEPKR
jgi:hypothetical protein